MLDVLKKLKLNKIKLKTDNHCILLNKSLNPVICFQLYNIILCISTLELFKTRHISLSPLGFMGTNTSQEIEALHKALREVGLSPTLKNNDTQPPLDDSTLAGSKSKSELLQKILAAEPESGG